MDSITVTAIFWIATLLVDYLGMADPVARIIKIILAIVALIVLFGFGVGFKVGRG